MVNSMSQVPDDVPEYLKHELLNKNSKYCICIFVINEGEKFHKQLFKMSSYSNIIDIVVADGGSNDGSTEPEALRQFNVNTLLIKQGVGKLGTQMRMAFSWAINRGYEGVVVIDGNNKDSVENIPDFIQKLDEGYDHVQGSRFIPGGQHINTPLSRLIGVRLIHSPVIRLASGFHYTDTTNGYRAYSKRFLTDPRVSVFRDIFTGYELHYYLAIRAARLGFRCIEIPVTRQYPDTGKIPTKISPIRGNLEVMKKIFQVVIGKYNPKDI